MQRILITGANRGLGLEFVRVYLTRGERVIATARHPDRADQLNALRRQHPDRLSILPLDVSDTAAIAALRGQVAGLTDGLDLLINNAGIYSPKGSAEDPSGNTLGQLRMEDGLTLMRVNAIAPLLVAQALMDLLQAGSNPRIASVSSGYGSVSSNDGHFPYHYSASKAALNMYMRSLAGAAGKLGVTVVVLTPGWVRTDMGGPNATLSTEESVAGMVRVLDGVTPAQNGQFLSWDGSTEAW